MIAKKDNKATLQNKTETGIISRKEALKKAGKYAAFTAGSMLFFFRSKDAIAASLPQNPGEGW